MKIKKKISRAGVRVSSTRPSAGSTAPRSRVSRKTQSERPRRDARLLRKAAEVILLCGWIDGERHAADGRVCALGALELALPRMRTIEGASPSTVIALARTLPTSDRECGALDICNATIRVAQWSNYIAKNAENVAAHMIRTALRLEGIA